MAVKPSYKTDDNNVPQFPYECFAIVPDTDYSLVFSGGVTLLVTVTGNLTLTPQGTGPDVVLPAVPAYTIIPFRVKTVKAASTATVLGII